MRSLVTMVALLAVPVSVRAQQHGAMPPPLPTVPVGTSVAAESGVRLALVQPPDAPVVIDAVAHADDRLAGRLQVRNRSGRAVSSVAVAFTIGGDPAQPTMAFRHVETLPLTLPAGETATVDVPGIAVALLRSLTAADAPVVEVGIVGARFTSGPAWRAVGRSSWLARPDVPAPLTCVDDVGQTQGVDALTALTAGSTVCQGGGQ